MSEGRTLDNSLVRSSATEFIWDAVLGSFAEVWQFLTKQGKSTQKDWENKAVKIRGSREAWKCPFSLLLESPEPRCSQEVCYTCTGRSTPACHPAGGSRFPKVCIQLAFFVTKGRKRWICLISATLQSQPKRERNTRQVLHFRGKKFIMGQHWVI